MGALDAETVEELGHTIREGHPFGEMCAGSGGESPNPGMSTAITSNSRDSGSISGSQIAHSDPIPWISTSGSPAPAR